MDRRYGFNRKCKDIGNNQCRHEDFKCAALPVMGMTGFKHFINPRLYRGQNSSSPPRKIGAQAPAAISICLAIASTASDAFAPSGPPAYAISGRPPPPLPPTAAAPARTRSTAEIVAVRSSVTPTATAALPSFTPIKAATPEPSFFLVSSIRPRKSFAATPSRTRPANLTPANSLNSSPPDWTVSHRPEPQAIRVSWC